jgi:carboxyl-terminal processing protease
MRITMDRKLLLGLSAGLIALIVAGAMMGKAVAVEGTYSYLKLFNEALYLIVNNYVQPVQVESLMEGAYRGMLETLDPSNEYLSARDFQRAARGESGGPADVGLTLSKRRGYIAVISVLGGSPAAQAGMGSGTFLISIDGISTRSMGVWRATQALRGKPGTKVTATISAPPEAGLRRTVTLTRALLPPAVPVALLDGPDLGVARVAGVQEGDARRLEQTIAGLRRRGASRLLLDLRGCSSTTALAEGIGMASLFVRDGTIVNVTDRYDGDKAFRADGRRLAWERPLAVLVDEGTAGVCEVLAAALRDALDAAVLGERTWGQGSVLKLIPLQNGDGVILAVGTYLSPSGKEWNGKGIEPDLAIEGEVSDPGDPQRQKAIDYLRGVSLPSERKAA